MAGLIEALAGYAPGGAPEVFHSNLGPKWTYTGLTYLVDDPVEAGSKVQRDLHRRNTYYWDTATWARHQGDYAKARIKHWLIGETPTDDVAALANFNFHFVTQGTVERLPDVDGKARYKVTLDRVGIYVQDSYDFNDNPASRNPKTWVSQPLGYWDCAEMDVFKTPGFGAYYVDNDDFREWRDKYGNGKGGDYLVFSDIKVINVNDTFTFTD
ncbi:MAG: DUF6402 family protein [Azoarcus sp.]|nr:DUF6402 family protein [Azoarcus sp.]